MKAFSGKNIIVAINRLISLPIFNALQLNLQYGQTCVRTFVGLSIEFKLGGSKVKQHFVK